LDEELPIREKDWLEAASHNEAFDFLKDETEDIYTLADGKALYFFSVPIGTICL
jgi:hypothetical protein